MRIDNFYNLTELDTSETAQIRYQNAYVKRTSENDFEFISYNTRMFVISFTSNGVFILKINNSPSSTTSKQITTFFQRSFMYPYSVQISRLYKKLHVNEILNITALMSL